MILKTEGTETKSPTWKVKLWTTTSDSFKRPPIPTTMTKKECTESNSATRKMGKTHDS
jgi:hypothetical protein